MGFEFVRMLRHGFSAARIFADFETEFFVLLIDVSFVFMVARGASLKIT